MENNNEHKDLVNTLLTMRKALQVSVKIDHEEVIKIVVRDLISKRNSSSNNIRNEFDAVLRYYITEDEFDKYVISGEEI